jgi:murein DD-endopeptidase MepM/ murein hydrolase activator NlpD
MPGQEVKNWLALESALDAFLERAPRQTSSYDVIRARVTMEAELELDGRRYGDIPGDLADDVTDRIGQLAMRMAQLRRLKVRAREAMPPFVWPVEPVTVTSLFGRRFHPILKMYRQHSGIDLAADLGQSVSAAARGTVRRAEYTDTGGNLLEIAHGPTVTTRYEHLSYFLVKVGDVVQQGEPIGLAGQSGAATGPHLHFELWREGRPCDPLEELEHGQGLPGPVASGSRR